MQVEADVVVPVEAASDKQEVGARTLRPKLHKLWERFLKPVETVGLRHPSVRMRVDGDVDVSDVEGTLGVAEDRSVGPAVTPLQGWTSRRAGGAARLRLAQAGRV